MKKIFIIILFSYLAFSCSTTTESSYEESNKSLIEMSDEEIAAAGIKLGNIFSKTIHQELTCIGTVDVPPQNLASVHAKIEGFAREVKFLPGDYVKRGDILVVLEHPNFIARQQQLIELKSKLTFLEAEYNRKKELFDQEASSLKLLQQAESEYQSVNSMYLGLRAELEMTGFNAGQIESKQNLQTTLQVRSPINGYITKQQVNLGKLVLSNDLLYEIVDREHLHVELQVFAKDVPLIKIGDTLRISFPGKSKSYMANIYLVGKQIDAQTRTTNVHAHLLNEAEEKELVLGSTFQATIYAQPRKAWVLPLAAGAREENKFYFFKKVPDGFEKVLLQTGSNSREYLEITDVNEELLATKFALNAAYYLQGMATEEEE
ncbi:MAG TPA: efflux RND transporter periplasmic adaptor subunit [Cyclobacteriaceae bacterium]|nr:efflux RND transporter periplasmic adaptor subunit [Cyclobacteriaceae bacterium]